jgi:membrane fusion protein (multidrug efflux system)
MPVEVAEVRPQTVRDEFRALGSIESDEIIQVVSELNATVVSVPFAEGRAVAKGTLIAKLDDREIRAEAERAQALREQAASASERAEKLAQQNVISSQELDDARASLKVARAAEAVAEARLAKTRITAPFSGVIGTRRVSPGAYLKSGDVITELARVDDMKVTFSAPERFLGEMERGGHVMVTTPAFPHEAFAGRVTVVNPIVDPQTRTVQMVARIPNRGGMLKPGMSANVSVTFSERAGALTVPDEAVFAEGSQSFVYVVKPDSTVARTVISLGTRDSSSVEVRTGLEPGVLVVRTGHQKLFDGAKVMPVMSGAPAGPGSPDSGGPKAAEAGGGRGTAQAATREGDASKKGSSDKR